MSHNLPKIIEYVKNIASRTLEQNGSAAVVLNNCINQYAVPLIKFKQTGLPPDMEGLQDLAGKLIAIVAATYDLVDMKRGSLP